MPSRSRRREGRGRRGDRAARPRGAARLGGAHLRVPRLLPALAGPGGVGHRRLDRVPRHHRPSPPGVGRRLARRGGRAWSWRPASCPASSSRPVGGVLVDRWDRKKVMVVCDLGRAAILVVLPFVDTVCGLVLASLVLEVLHPHVVAGQGGVGAQPRARGAAHHRQLAVARGRLRHLPDRVAAVRAPGHGRRVARQHRRSCTSSASTRRRWRFYFDVLTFLTSALHHLPARAAAPDATAREASHHEGQDRASTWARRSAS